MPLQMRSVETSNRIVVAPMTQLSADDGVAGGWHFVHRGQYALAETGLIPTESCYVEPNAPSCLSPYNDAQEAGLARVISFTKQCGNGTFGVQFCLAGRKASAKTPEEDGGPRPVSVGGYRAVAPSLSPISFALSTPRELELSEVQDVIEAFVAAPERTDRIGADVIELHGAHGYLLHQFLSPISNRRIERYDGSGENRQRFVLDLFEAVRAVFPQDKVVGIRLSVTDWVPWGVEPRRHCRALSSA